MMCDFLEDVLYICDKEENKEMSWLPISEVFYSLQGEGWDSGCAAVFVRVRGCPIHCDFCDTVQISKIMSQTKMTSDIIVNEVLRMKEDNCPHCQNIVITGGEPLLPEYQEGVRDVIIGLSNHFQKKCKINIETSGAYDPLPEIIYNSSITCSPKEKTGWRICSGARYLKYVVTDSWNDSIPPKRWHNKIYLQPLYHEADAYHATGYMDQRSLRTIIQTIKEQPQRFRLSLQTHKIIGVR